MCVGSDITPKGVVSADAYDGEKVEEKSSGLQPGGTLQSKNMSWKHDGFNWSMHGGESPNQFWSVIVRFEVATEQKSEERSGG
jgi:hypothetical protein